MAKMDIDFGLGVLHVGVLRAKLRRRAGLVRGVIVVCVLLLIGAIAYTPLQPMIYGTGTLQLADIPAGARVQIDQRDVIGAGSMFTVVSGTHTVLVEQDGVYPQVFSVDVPRDQATTLTIPPGRARPTVQTIPLPAPGSSWHVASPDAQSGWRLLALSADINPTPVPNQPVNRAAQQLSPLNHNILRLNERGLVRLAALEAYVASDEIVSSIGRSWAAWEPDPNDASNTREGGVLTITTPWGNVTQPTAADVTGLWWSPEGRWLLIASRQGIGQNLTLWSNFGGVVQDTAGNPIATIPGTIEAVHWSPSGQAALVLSSRQPTPAPVAGAAAKPLTLEATLILPAETVGESRALNMSTPPPSFLGMTPMAWGRDALWWVTQTPSGLELEHIPFSAALPTRVGVLPPNLVAVTVVDGDQIRTLLQESDGQLVMNTWPGNNRLFVFDDIPVTNGVSGLWRDTTLLISNGPDRLWNVNFALQTLR